jgi:hypothetical protein
MKHPNARLNNAPKLLDRAVLQGVPGMYRNPGLREMF